MTKSKICQTDLKKSTCCKKKKSWKTRVPYFSFSTLIYMYRNKYVFDGIIVLKHDSCLIVKPTETVNLL